MTLHSGEASTRAALVSELAKGDRLHLARCGILGKPFVDAIANCGVPRETVETMVAKIRKEVDTGSFEVYSSVHHQHDSVGANLVLTERSALLELAGRVKFDDAKRRGTHLNLATISESFEVEFGGRSRAQEREEAAEALDTGGRRERSHSGAKEASETRKSKENG